MFSKTFLSVALFGGSAVKRDNDITSETSLGQDCFLSAAECRQTVVHKVDPISGCGLQKIRSLNPSYFTVIHLRPCFIHNYSSSTHFLWEWKSH